MQRITVTIDDEVAAEARRDVAAGRSPSLSAWVADAMRQKALARIRLELELDERRATDPYTDEDVDFASRVLGVERAHAADVLRTPIRGAQP